MTTRFQDLYEWVVVDLGLNVPFTVKKVVTRYWGENGWGNHEYRHIAGVMLYDTRLKIENDLGWFLIAIPTGKMARTWMMTDDKDYAKLFLHDMGKALVAKGTRAEEVKQKASGPGSKYKIPSSDPTIKVISTMNESLAKAHTHRLEATKHMDQIFAAKTKICSNCGYYNQNTNTYCGSCTAKL